MPEQIKTLARYPFLRETADFIRRQKIEFSEVLKKGSAYEDARKAGFERVLEAINYGMIKEHPLATDTQCLIEILSYPIARMLVSAVSNPYLVRRYALSEAVRANERLADENVEFVLKVADELELEQSAVDDEHIKLHVGDFLYYTSALRAPEWKLVNQEIEKGYVILPTIKFIRIIQNALQKKIESELPLPVDDTIKVAFASELETIINLSQTMKKTYKAEDFGRISVVNLPPCMRAILAKIQAGENVPHQARFALTAFLHTLGLSGEEIIKLFSQCPDFDESKSRYQIEHITGKISGTEYTPPECATMKSYGLCTEPDGLCKQNWLKHPLQYYRARLRAAKKMGRKKRGEN